MSKSGETKMHRKFSSFKEVNKKARISEQQAIEDCSCRSQLLYQNAIIIITTVSAAFRFTFLSISLFSLN